MSSIMQRISLIFRSKANKALDKAEDPRETLDYSYTKQQELLQKVRRGVADVATSRKRLELQIQQLDQQQQKLQSQAQQALAAGREDLAREALTRKAGSPAADRGPPGPARAAAGRGGEADQRLPAAAGEGRGLPDQEGDAQGHATRRPRRRPRSTRPSPASPRRWATSAWRSSAPRTRQRRCRPGPVPSTS